MSSLQNVGQKFIYKSGICSQMLASCYTLLKNTASQNYVKESHAKGKSIHSSNSQCPELSSHGGLSGKIMMDYGRLVALMARGWTELQK